MSGGISMIELGGVLKQARLKKGFTLDDVATRCGYSKALISRIENNNVFPSIESLSKIAEVLGIPLYEIFATVPFKDHVVLRKGNREKFRVSDGEFDMEFLVSDPRSAGMLPILYSGEPKAHSTHRMGEHAGQEWSLITKGRVEITIGDRKYLLKEGDSIYFNSGIPHKYVNVGKEQANGVCVTIPPSY
jgi:transcriptional regulator with XRE-family HTH domain